MDKIRSIICCCGQGLGSSMIMEMNVKKALRALGRNDISVSHVSLVDAAKDKGDIYICGLDVAYQLRDFPRQNLENKASMRSSRCTSPKISFR